MLLALLMLLSDLQPRSPLGPVFPSSQRRLKNIATAIQAGDQSGNWWVLNQDGTTSGSALTMAGINTPGTSPLSFNGTDQYWRSAAVAFPGATDYSFVVAIAVGDGVGSKEVVAKYDGGANLVFTLELASGTVPRFYATSAAGVTASAQGSALTPGTMACLGGRYTTATGGIVLRVGGSNVTGTAGAGGVFAGSVRHSVGAHLVPGGFLDGTSRGVFYTEKALSDADVDRVCTGVL